MNRKEVGKLGELYAQKYLIRNGYKIISTNWSNRLGEIDIICTYNDIIVFVEVKTKIGSNYGIPENMISKKKLYQVKKISTWYLNYTHTNTYVQTRLDAICIVLLSNYKIRSLNHYKALYF